jgi:hypothetical protein
MKNIYALSVLLMLTIGSVSAQTIRRVNNNPGVTGTNIYPGLQEAHDAAVSGDIIYIEPTATPYGSLVSTKQLKLYGPGYFLDVNQELVGSQGKNAPISGTITLNNGSAGTEMDGINMIAGIITVNVSNVSIRRSFVGSIIEIKTPSAAVSNITIERNYLGQVSVNDGGGTFLVSNVLIQNNMGIIYLLGSYYSGFRITTGPLTSNINIKNNNLWDVYASNSLVENNIISRNDLPGTFTCTTCTVQNNVAAGTLPGGNGNQSNVIVENEFAYGSNAALPAGTSRDEAYQLKSGSTLKTAGSGGTEVGAFGGGAPYIISGIPAIPAISNLYVTPTGNATTPLTVTVSAKSNN